MINTKDIDYLKEFGKNLRRMRKQKGMSQEELANNADVSLPQITRIERGVVNPTICTIRSLAKGLDVSMSSIFDIDWNNEKH